jgi:hypothetical protein
MFPSTCLGIVDQSGVLAFNDSGHYKLEFNPAFSLIGDLCTRSRKIDRSCVMPGMRAALFSETRRGPISREFCTVAATC